LKSGGADGAALCISCGDQCDRPAGKTCAFSGLTNSWFKTHDLAGALAPDQPDQARWCGFALRPFFNTPGVPLVDFKAIGRPALIRNAVFLV